MSIVGMQEALNLDWEMGVEMHMKEKFILQGSMHFLCTESKKFSMP